MSPPGAGTAHALNAGPAHLAGRQATGAAAMKPRVTNVRATVTAGSPAVSIVEVESTLPASRHALDCRDPGTLRLLLWGLRLNMDPFERLLLDGIVRSVRLFQALPDCVECRIRLELAGAGVDPHVQVEPGMPVVTRVVLSREPLRRLLRGRRITVDPAHGGRDVGARGPINLEERHVVLKIASRLVWHLREAGCEVSLTRQDDRDVDESQRLRAAVARRAEVLVSLHTAHDTGQDCRGIRTLVVPGAGGEPARAQALAESVHAALLERLGLPDRGMGTSPVPAWALASGTPPHASLLHVWVEPVCIGNPLDEALLRSVVFRDRIAQAIRNGLARFYAAAGNGDAALAL